MERITSSVILLLLAISGIAALGHAEVVDRIAAVVNGEVITLSMVEDAMNAIWIAPLDRPKSRQDALEWFIDRKLELQEAQRMGVGVDISEESLFRELAKVASRFASPEEFSQAMRRRGVTQENLIENLIEEIMVQEMVNRRFRGFVEVTDLEASDFFERNREKFVVLESVHLSQLFFQLAPDVDETIKEAVRREAEKVFEELRNGADFSEYIREAEEVGYDVIDRGYVSVDKLQNPAVAAAVSRLEVGKIDLIETPVGYFIVKLNDRRPTRQASFQEVKEEIKTSLARKKTDDELKDWLREQRESADIRIKVDFKD